MIKGFDVLLYCVYPY